MLQWAKYYGEEISRTIEFSVSLSSGEEIDTVEVIALDLAGIDVAGSLIGGTSITGTQVSVRLMPSGVGRFFISVVVITAPGGYRITQEIELLVKPTGNDIDLTTLEAVKRWAEIKSDAEDGDIQACITAFSQFVLIKAGRDTVSRILQFLGIYSGENTNRLYLRNFPIVSVESVYVNGISLPISTGYGANGIIIADQKRSIAMRMNPGASAMGFSEMIGYPAFTGRMFSSGIGNIQVLYTAGNNGAPPDLEMACREAVSTNYKRRAWQDLASKNLSATGVGGSTTYRDWHLSPGVERVLLNQARLVPTPCETEEIVPAGT
jgi:hypothetical protein